MCLSLRGVRGDSLAALTNTFSAEANCESRGTEFGRCGLNFLLCAGSGVETDVRPECPLVCVLLLAGIGHGGPLWVRVFAVLRAVLLLAPV